MKILRDLLSEMSQSKLEHEIEVLKFGIAQHDKTNKNFIDADRLENMLILLQQQLADIPNQIERDKQAIELHNKMKYPMKESVASGIGSFLRMKQNGFLTKVQNEDQLNKKMDLLSQQIVSLSSMIMLSVLVTDKTLNQYKFMLKK